MSSPTATTYGILNPEHGRRHFSLTRYPPAADLAGVVERNWVVEWDLRGREPFTQELIPHPCVVGEMLTLRGEARVAEIASRHGLSARGLQRLFREHIGVSPKWMLSRYRVHEAAERLAAGESSSPSRLAHDLGFCDQAHLNRAFRLLVGQTPARYARACAVAAGADPGS